MPKYNKKITRQMDFEEFNTKIERYQNALTGKPLPRSRRAFLTVLYFSGCRVSEALALTPDDINCTPDTIYVLFFRLKGSKQTDPIPLPRVDTLDYLCGLVDDPFPWSRTTGYRIVKRAFPSLYPHYFRMNRFTDIAEKFPLATVVSFSGLNPLSVKHYLAKVDIKRVGKALREEIS